MGTGLLNTLVTLVTLGVGGVCIVAIFWSGWLLLKLPPDTTAEKHKSVRLLMVVSIIIAVMSSVAGLISTRFNAEDSAELEATHQELVDRYEMRTVETMQVV